MQAYVSFGNLFILAALIIVLVLTFTHGIDLTLAGVIGLLGIGALIKPNA